MNKSMRRIFSDRRVMLAGIGGVMAGTFLSPRAIAGTLNPPGPPAPTGRTTDDLANMIARPSGVSEPRTPVAGLPGTASSKYVISASGSYCATENFIAAAGQSGIQITADNVDLDLQGFHLVGGDNAGLATAGIVVTGSNVSIYNGTLEGPWSIAMQVNAPKFLLWDVTVIGAAGTGFLLGTDGQCYDCDVYECPTGFDAHGQRTIVEECGAWSCPTSFAASGTQNLIISNCATNSANPFGAIIANNAYGPIIVVTGVGNIGQVAGSNHILANYVF